MEYTEDQERRMQEARERIRAAEAETQALETKRARDAEIAELEMQAKDAEAIRAAKAEHPDLELKVVRTPAGCVVLKRPHAAVYKRFRDRGEYKTKALEDLVRKSLVHPSAAGLDAILEEAPATLDAMADAVIQLCGLREKEAAEK